MYNKPYTGTKPASFNDTSKVDIPVPTGIYIGTVKRIDTNTRSGRLFVYIDKFGSADPDDQGSWKLVSYASPFGGTTSGPGTEYQISSSTNKQNTFQQTQQTYGFWMTPPDIGSQVLCCFLPNTLEGYWFACVNTSVYRNMTPAIGSVPWDRIDKNSIPSDLLPYLKPGTPYPVAEVNRYIQGIGENYLPNIPKPIHIPQTLRLITQGLDKDPTRGAISSSAQRDPISAVYGFSTPGRPIPAQDPANYPNIQQKIVTGNFNAEDFKVTTRIGGHSFVMDDGDIYGNSNLVRIKTSQGHQILMNDKDGFMYIANSEGTAWIELTKTGDILVYGAKDFAVRAQGNVMFTSDNSINFYAKRGVNLNSAGTINLEATAVNATGTQSLNFYGKQAQVKSQGTMVLNAGGSMAIKAGGSIAINGSAIALNGGGGGSSVSPPKQLPRFRTADTAFVNNNWTVIPDAIVTCNYKVPTHEPYVRGSVSQLLQTQTAQAVTVSTDVEGNPISPPEITANAGPEVAQTVTVTDPAPTQTFITQPVPTGEIGVLSTDQVRAYLAQLGHSESEGDYTYQSTLGYMGKYQLSSKTLQEQGYLIAGTPQTEEAINNPNNWTGKNGINSADDFKTNPSVQETVMYDVTRSNYATLQSNGVITSGTDPAEAAGLLATAHLINPAATTRWYQTGQPTSNAYGSTAVEYYNQGRYAITQVPTIAASNAAQNVTTTR